MTIHYIIYDNREWAFCEHKVVFFFADCHPADMIGITRYIMSLLDKSVGRVNYNDWDWSVEQGTMHITGATGVPKETLAEVCDKIMSQVKDVIATMDVCCYCKKGK